jgi:formate hydrogenlyase subunit 3/multisubunit Na+/H+ antiporter MnhD subunit
MPGMNEALALTAAPAMALAIALPLLGSLAAAAWPRRSRCIGLLTLLFTGVCVAWLFIQVFFLGASQQALGGWQTGLAIALRADALAVVMLGLTAAVGMAVSVYATRYFHTAQDAARFWPLWLLLVAALNGLFLSADLFNLYVTLELLGLSAVALTALGGKRESIRAALRYLLVGLLGSLGYLAGVAILYAAYGTLDMQQVGARIGVDPASAVALLLMTAGLLLKTALFPLHFWLPAAHSNAPAPVSAALSALVVKAGFYLVLRLWSEVFPEAVSPHAALLLGLLGCAAILWGSWQALQAQRLKLLAAYSTVAQLGYLFVGLMLLVMSPAGPTRELVFGALMLMAINHGFAKSSLFLAIGVVQQHAGHDRIDQLDGTAQSLPATTFAFALAGVALIGLPPSGAFLGKWHLLATSIDLGQWLLVLVMGIGSLLAAAYVFRVLGHAFGNRVSAIRRVNVASAEWPALVLGLIATLGLGLGGAWLWAFLGANP